MNTKASTIGVIVMILLAIFFRSAHSSPAAPADDNSSGVLRRMIDSLRLKVDKIEALVTLMKQERDQQLAGEPLREEHLAPLIVPVTQTQVPGREKTPGMEPAQTPTKSTPVQTVTQAPVSAAGHWERRGWRGQRSVWVPDGTQFQSQPVQYYQSYRGGSCSSGRCGGIF